MNNLKFSDRKLSKPVPWEEAESGALNNLWADGYRQVSGVVIFALSVAAGRYMGGEIGLTTYRRKYQRNLRRLDRALLRQDVPLLNLAQA